MNSQPIMKKSNKSWRTNRPKAFQLHFAIPSTAPVGAHLTFARSIMSWNAIIARGENGDLPVSTYSKVRHLEFPDSAFSPKHRNAIPPKKNVNSLFLLIEVKL